MSTTQTSCPECGSPAAVGSPCPHCEAEEIEAGDPVVAPGETYTFPVSGSAVGLEGEEFALTVLVVDEWADLLNRAVYVVEAIACRRPAGEEPDDEDLVGALDSDRFLLEVCRTECDRGLEELPDEEDLPVRRPVGRKRIDGSRVYLFRNEAGISLAELVTLADGELELRRVAGVFEAVLEGLGRLHRSGLLHLYLAPETVRVRPAGSRIGIPLAEIDPDATDPDTDVRRFDEETDGESPGFAERAETAEDNPFEEGYDETRPQESLASRLEALGAEEFPDVEESTSSLAESSSEVNDDGVDAESWIYELLGASSPGAASDEQAGVASAEQDVHETPPAERDPFALEVVFDSASGLFDIEEPPDELEVLPGFSAPEAYTRGEPKTQAVSDVFSAGMLLYYLVSGRIPPVSIYTRHAPAVPARSFRPSFPPGLAPVVKRAGRPDPDKRYPDVESMASGFENAVAAIEDRGPAGREQIPAMQGAVDRHIGVAKRERNPVNQDDVFYGSSEKGEFGLIVVADGVSTASYGTGDVASRLLIETAEEHWNDLLPAYLMEEPIDEVGVVDAIFAEANDRIVEYVNERHTPFDGAAHEVMGTTGLVALYHGGRVTLGSVGDSRGYLQRGPGLEQLTVDHNLWTLSILEGVPADEALSMPRGDALARCLGAFDIDEGRLDSKSPGVDMFQFPVTAGDTLLLTTDGLVDFAGSNVTSAEENILATLLSEPDPALACLELILLANRGGGGDNIGLGVARFQ